jgi:ABC-type amino acid transport substrate-binding protein
MPRAAYLLALLVPLFGRHAAALDHLSIGLVLDETTPAYVSAARFALELAAADRSLAPGITSVSLNVTSSTTLIGESDSIRLLSSEPGAWPSAAKLWSGTVTRAPAVATTGLAGCGAEPGRAPPLNVVVGAGTSTSAQYIRVAAAARDVSLMSFFATSESLSGPSLDPHFSRVVPSDGLRAEATLAFLRHRGFKRVGVVFSPGPFGSGFYLALVKGAKEYGVTIVRGVDITSPGATAAIGDLRKLEFVRIFIASIDTMHIGITLAAAATAGLLRQGFVWIATDAVFDLSIQVQQQNPNATTPGVGWLGVVPQLDAGAATREFDRRWLALDPAQYPGAGVPSTVYEWLISDAITAAFRAVDLAIVHNARCDVSGAMIGTAMRNVSFVGATGAVQFDKIANRISEMDVLNVQPDGSLSAIAKVSTDGNLTTGLAPEFFIGNSTPVVGGGIRGRVIRAAVQESPPFQTRVEAADGSVEWRGAVIDIAREIESLLGFQFEFVEAKGISYNEMIEKVADGEYDMAVSDVTITEERLQSVRFTRTIIQTSLSIGVRKEKPAVPWFRILGPFTTGVWFSLLATFGFVALVIFTLERGTTRTRIPQEKISEGIGESLWFTFTNITFSQQYDLASPWSKFFLSGWLLFVLFSVTLLQAQLTSTLTVQRIAQGVQSVDDLKSRRTGVVGDTAFEDHLISLGVNTLVTRETTTELIDALAAGDVDAIVDDIHFFRFFFSSRCDMGFAGPTFYNSLWGWPVSPTFEYLDEMNGAIAQGWDEGWLTNKILEGSTDGGTVSCAEFDIGSKIGLGEFVGLYLVLFALSMLALTAKCASHFRKKRYRAAKAAGRAGISQNGVGVGGGGGGGGGVKPRAHGQGVGGRRSLDVDDKL